MLDPKITSQLEQPLDTKRIKHRAGGGGMQLSYLKGYDVIDTANRIFGYGQWGCETLSCELQTVPDENGKIIGCYYAASVKLSIVGCMPVSGDGVCPVQEGRNPRAKIDAHDMARKGAITDAMKRAFRFFGNQFGNSLYDSDLVNGQPRDNARPNNTQPAANNNNRAAATNSNNNNSNRAAAPANRPIPINSQVQGQARVQPNPAHEQATTYQRDAILKMADKRAVSRGQLDAELTELYGYGLGGLTQKDAGHFITLVQKRERQQA